MQPKSSINSVISIVSLLIPSINCFAQDCGPRWLPGDGFPGMNSVVHTLMVWDSDGDDLKEPLLIAGGAFKTAGPTTVANIAAWDGTSWQSLASEITATSTQVSQVIALTVFQGDVIAGGQFISIDGIPTNFIARWDGEMWHPLGTGFNAIVRALTVHEGELIAGGSFTFAGDEQVNYIARWDGAKWNAMDGGMSASVRALAVHNGELVAGGFFASSGSTVTNQIARWDGTSWQSIGNGTNGPVYELENLKGTLVVGGHFSLIDNVPVNNIALWNGKKWQGLGPGLNGTISDLKTIDDNLYVGGNFTHAGELEVNRIARWDGAWHNLETAMDGFVVAIEQFQGDIYVGGDFKIAGEAGASRIAQWNGVEWSALHNGFDSLLASPPSPERMAVFQDMLVFGGVFDTAGGLAASRVAGWNGHSWQTFGSGVNNYVDSVMTYGGNLIVAGQFTRAGESDAKSIAQWDGSTWHPLAEGLSNTNGITIVDALTTFDDDLIAGGNFQVAGGTSALRIAKWDGTAWHPMGAGMNGSVNCLTTFNGNLIAGGEFNIAGSSSAKGIARWDGTSWAPLGAGIEGSVNALAVYKGELIAGGTFTIAGGAPANRIAKWNGKEWAPLDEGLEGPVVNAVNVQSLAVYRDQLIVGGNFANAGGVSALRIARWDGAEWHSMGSGMDNYVSGLCVFGGEVIACGFFINANGQLSRHSARWTIDGVPWIAQQPMNAIVQRSTAHSFDAIATDGYSDLSYQWRKDGQEIVDGITPYGSSVAGSTSASLLIENIQPDDAGAYDATVSNPCGLAQSTAATLFVTIPADITTNGIVDVDDLLAVINAWGLCRTPSRCAADIVPDEGDGIVDTDDLLEVINNWTS
jgi:trimeric autotransporter adhesin